MNKRHTLLLPFLLMLPLFASAQQLTLKSFALTNQIIAGDDRKTDWNDTPCAIVKVQGAELDSVAGAFDVTQRGAELWIYVTKGSRHLTLYKRGYEAANLNFRSYGIDGAESNRVYLLVVNAIGAFPQIDTHRQTVEVIIRTTTPGTRIFVNNEEKGTDVCMLQLSPQTYIIKGEKSGFKSKELSVTLNNGHKEITIPALEQNISEGLTGTANISFNPSGSNIYIDGQLMGTTPQFFSDLIIGKHSVEVRHDGYDSFQGTIDITANEHAVLSGNLTKAKEKNVKKAKRAKKEQTITIEEEQIKSNQEVEDYVEVQQNNTLTPLWSENRQDLKFNSRIRRTSPVVFSLRAGLNIASAEFESGYNGGSSVMGLHIGVTVDFSFSESLWLSTGLGYSCKGYKYKGGTDVQKANPAYLEVHALLSWHPLHSDAVTLQLNAGPYVSYCVDGKVTNESGAINWSFSSAYSDTDYGVQAGADIVFTRHILIGASYQYGLASAYKNRCIGLHLGYQF